MITANAERETTRKIESVRDLFEIPDDITYLNCANMSPQLRSVTQAGIEAVKRKANPWNLTAAEWFSGAEELRSACAQLFKAEADGIALIPAASYGIAIAAANLEIKPGQSIILLDQEFPSNFYAWRELAKRQDAEIRTVQRQNGENWTAAVLRSIDASTAIISIPHCHWMDGSAVDLVSVSECARSVGAAIVIDASQSLGACPLDLESIQPDFVVAVGYKWLLGPYGLGYMYVAPKWRDRGTPLEYSWLSRGGSEDFSKITYRDDYQPGARRFDMGEFPQFVLSPMACAALKQIQVWGIDQIHQSLSLLTNYVWECAKERGYSVLPRNERLGHMIGIRFPAGVPAGLVKKLTDAKIYVSLRGDSLRVAPHLYNNRADIDHMFDVLP
ncbi:MAG TPA: aminotransferase class V-fold PLP-dependent enzyme [Terriglobales bacterium]|nr:aminotransferase class V-fold PLP-dependent enzyme [Terriglobales bacterium]